MDWPRFWGQFTETVDKAHIAAINKFTYLCGFLGPNVKHRVEALPFTAEGYNRAKSILADQYGKNSEIVKAYIKEIMNLPHISGANPKKIAEFSEKLNYSVQALETLKRLKDVQGNVSMTLDKLPAIRGDLVRDDPDWENWDFVKLAEAIKQWTKRNPVYEKEADAQSGKTGKYGKVFHTKATKVCVYCEGEHKTGECTVVTSVSDRRGILAKKKLCFNCATGQHRANACPSKSTCRKCNKRHHTSICDVKDREQDEQDKGGRKVLTASASTSEGIFPVVVVKVNGITCRALIDSGAGSSYISGKLASMLNVKPKETRTSKIDMLLTSKITRLDIYEAKVESVDNDYSMDVKLIKVEKGELLTVDNPNYQKLQREFDHLKQAKFIDNDQKSQLPVHVVLGSGEYARIKTRTNPLVGTEGQPIAEKTKLGWFAMSPGVELNHNTMLLTQTSQKDYEDLCRLDVLGLADGAEHDQSLVYSEFKEQLTRSPAGWYETGLPWRGNHPPLLSNKSGSMQRLQSLERRLQRKNLTEDYNTVIEQQKQQGIVEPASNEAIGKEFYLPHKEVVRESAQSTKLRVVYDASAKPSPESPSLNDCLYAGPPLQNKLWQILVRARSFPVVITGDIQKAFLQIRVKECERDALRFHWRADPLDNVQVLRFTRVLFGLVSSPFLLGGVLEAHLDHWTNKAPAAVDALKRSLYVDDIISGGNTVEEARQRKSEATDILGDATFSLHKWASNVNELDGDGDQKGDRGEQTAAKQELGVKPTETKILGTQWDKENDTLTVQMGSRSESPTKRTILSRLAKVYDPLGIASPLLLQGKQVYREVCDTKLPWDADLKGEIKQQWERWEDSLSEVVTIPRPIAPFREMVEKLEIHGFGDASGEGLCAVVYTVARQPSGVTQELLAAKARLAKTGLTIPRLELVACHMATNLVINASKALDHIPHERHCWSDSTVALWWIKGEGHYKQFVENRVAKIRDAEGIEWHHVPTRENPADLGRGGGQLTKLWLNGPAWLQERSCWPPDLVLQPTTDSQSESKATRAILNTGVEQVEPTILGKVLKKHPLSKTLRIGAWIKRFLNNIRVKEDCRKYGPLTTEEIDQQRFWWIKQVQNDAKEDPNFQSEAVQLNVQEDADRVLRCYGRVQGKVPIYLPDNALFTLKLVEEAHLQTLHGGVILTMAKIRENYWIPRLRRLVKKSRKGCPRCRRFLTKPYQAPTPAPLPTTRTEGTTPYKVIGVDFAGPIKYKIKKTQEGKAYLVLYACSLTRGVYLEVLESLETLPFLRSLKRLIARRGRPSLIYSDNAKTFQAAASWLKKVMKDENFHSELSKYEIKWKFNLSRAPWWGGQFERLIGIFKSAFYKVVGKGLLTFEELSDVVLDVEICMNNRPLSYLEDDIEFPILTPNSFVLQQSNVVPELEGHHIEDGDLRKRAKYLRNIKNHLWSRWQREYLTSLRQHYQTNHRSVTGHPKEGDIVLIKGEEKNRNKWKIGKVTKLIRGKDKVVRGVKLQCDKAILERPIQLIYPLELKCDARKCETKLNTTAREFKPRRQAAIMAEAKNKELLELEEMDE